MSKIQKGLIAVAGMVGMVLPFATHAAADATLINAANTLATSGQENVLGILSSSTVLAMIGVFFAISVGIVFVIKLGRRTLK